MKPSAFYNGRKTKQPKKPKAGGWNTLLCVTATETASAQAIGWSTRHDKSNITDGDGDY